MTESFLTELKRYVRFGAEDGDALRAFADTARPHFGRIIDEFYSRLHEHDAARTVFDGPDQVSRLKVTLGEWLDLLFTGPWDDAYYERRARIGRVHVRIRLPQKYMFGAMDLIRIELVSIAESAALPDAARARVVRALHKIIDIELAIMLETYGETYVRQVQELEKLARKDLEHRLELSEARYDEVVEKGEALTVTFEPSGRMILFNRRAEEITGVDRAVATQRYWFDLFCVPADRELVRRSMDAVLAGKRVPPYEGPVLGPSGTERRVRWHFTTLPGTQGQILCAIGIDVTEERELATRTRRAERLAALGTMAAGLAHEIRNPLNAAHIQLTLAQRRIARHSAEPPEGVKVALDLAGSEMKRLAVLVEDFLQFARPQPPRLAFVDLRATAEVTVALVGPEAAALGVELALEPGEPLRLEFDDEKMKQVILNLLRNAIEAAAPGGHVLVHVRVKEGQGCLCVEDDGRGLPADAPIFEPFFTTKETGTGLGLAIVHRIVADHGGHIDCESRPGRTVFSVCLPMTAAPPPEAAAGTSDAPGTPRAQ